MPGQDNRREYRLVQGYHAVTPWPIEILRDRLLVRTALVVPPRVGTEQHFEYEIWNIIIRNTLNALQSNLEVETVADQWIPWTPDDLTIDWQSLPEENREPPLRLQLRRDSDIVCRIETELWCYSGGPEPYHDSYTYSFYTNATDAEIVRQTIKQCVTAFGIIVSPSAPFDQPPKGSSWLTRIYHMFKWLFMKNSSSAGSLSAPTSRRRR